MNSKKQVMRAHYYERICTTNNLSLDPPLPECLNIEVNNTCNQRCVFCPYHGSYTPAEITPAVLEADFVKKLMKQAWSLGIGRKEIGFYIAGEPLLYRNIIDVTGYAKELGFPYIFMTTNGALATAENMKALIDAGLNSIRFSVNASDRSKYADIHGRDDFDRVLDNIKNVHEYIIQNNLDVATSLSCVLTKQTYNIQSEMMEIFGDYVDDIAFIPVMLRRLSNSENVKKKYEIFAEDDLEVIPDYICPLLFNTMYVNALGRVVPCCNSYDRNIYFADLNDNSDLIKAWNSDGYRYYRSIFLEGVSDKHTICEDCILRKRAPKGMFLDSEINI